MSDASAAMEEIVRQRAALAARVQLPWWYVALFGLAVLALLITPLVAKITSWGVAQLGLMVPASVILVLFDLLLGYVTGAKLARGTLRAYPSSRPAGLSILALVVVGLVGVNLSLSAHLLPVVVLVSVVVAVGAARCLVWQAEGIRKDIREGRAVTT